MGVGVEGRGASFGTRLGIGQKNAPKIAEASQLRKDVTGVMCAEYVEDVTMRRKGP